VMQLYVSGSPPRRFCSSRSTPLTTHISEHYLTKETTKWVHPYKWRSHFIFHFVFTVPPAGIISHRLVSRSESKLKVL
jgi:hypothetical protein